MHIHILGVCGTFMGGIAALARALGHEVSGSDLDVYPPMSDQLQALGIALHAGWDASVLEPAPDLVIVGNALSRGREVIEVMLDRGLPYVSGPQWLAEQVLPGRRVLAVAGTHGKTTTSALAAWLLEACGQAPGFLIGGLPGNFESSARLGRGRAFVVEADEYDTAFFDKRSKFVHYRPEVAVLNNLEYDHADIFPDLAAIERQFHHLVRTVPRRGRIIVPSDDAALARVLAMGCWTPVETTGATGDWQARLDSADGSAFRLLLRGRDLGRVEWPLLGAHNVANAVSAVAAVSALGVDPVQATAALAGFRPPRRRLELLAEVDGIRIYDDFAHHPTAIATTLAGLRAAESGRLLVAVEPRSNSMRLGAHAAALPEALREADRVFLLARRDLGWDGAALLAPLGERAVVVDDVEALLAAIVDCARPGDRLVFMSNGGFEAAPSRCVERLRQRRALADATLAE